MRVGAPAGPGAPSAARRITRYRPGRPRGCVGHWGSAGGRGGGGLGAGHRPFGPGPGDAAPVSGRGKAATTRAPVRGPVPNSTPRPPLCGPAVYTPDLPSGEWNGGRALHVRRSRTSRGGGSHKGRAGQCDDYLPPVSVMLCLDTAIPPWPSLFQATRSAHWNPSLERNALSQRSRPGAPRAHGPYSHTSLCLYRFVFCRCPWLDP